MSSAGSRYGAGGGQNLPKFDTKKYTGSSSIANSGQTLSPLQPKNPAGNGPKPRAQEPKTGTSLDKQFPKSG
ncbi:hypothetical protein F4779DRAFT_614227 [Xylariaceae sp. FL0662B]|nr:hypothetical protein F4779DRAFT_614227 [Xylariaceae sp. FL0662B]